MIAERQTTVKFKEKPRWIKKNTDSPMSISNSTASKNSLDKVDETLGRPS